MAILAQDIPMSTLLWVASHCASNHVLPGLMPDHPEEEEAAFKAFAKRCTTAAEHIINACQSSSHPANDYQGNTGAGYDPDDPTTHDHWITNASI